MSSFAAMDIARTGMGFSRYWLDVVAHNLANVNNVHAPDDPDVFRARFVVAGTNTDEFATTGSGVHVADIEEAEGEPPIVYDPGHPLADEDGYVARSLVDVAGQMGDMILAQRQYQLNARSVTAAREAYEAALRIGDGR